MGTGSVVFDIRATLTPRKQLIGAADHFPSGSAIKGSFGSVNFARNLAAAGTLRGRRRPQAGSHPVVCRFTELVKFLPVPEKARHGRCKNSYVVGGTANTTDQGISKPPRRCQRRAFLVNWAGRDNAGGMI